MIERYPDSVIMTRTHAMHGSSVDMTAYDDNSDNELRVDFISTTWMIIFMRMPRCNVRNSDDHKKLGTTPPELIDDSPIPKFMFSNGEAREGFTAEFIRYTNCLDPKSAYDDVEELEADYYVAILENGGMPGCQETLSCFETYSLKIIDDVVSFRNFDSNPHTVTSGIPEFGPSNEFDSELMKPGDQFLHKFTESDEYDYFCLIHPWQIGKIIAHEK